MLGFKTKALTQEVRESLVPGSPIVYVLTCHPHGANLLEFVSDETPEIKINYGLTMTSYLACPSDAKLPTFLLRTIRRGDRGPAVEKLVQIRHNHRLLLATKEEYLAAQVARMEERPLWNKKQKEIYLRSGVPKKEAREMADRG
jgi:hypothetical protein